ncbi:MAG: hypothetical protein ACI83B_001603 [Sediminicola sp.]|jgi:hypothetical protein
MNIFYKSILEKKYVVRLNSLVSATCLIIMIGQRQYGRIQYITCKKSHNSYSKLEYV